jgi:tryptophanyl-tRNA synthetase
MEYYDDRSIVADFLRQYHCTSMMPQSSKVVVLDTGISIRAAFHALDENGTVSLFNWAFIIYFLLIAI